MQWPYRKESFPFAAVYVYTPSSALCVDTSMGPAERHLGLRHHSNLKGDPDVDYS